VTVREKPRHYAGDAGSCAPHRKLSQFGDCPSGLVRRVLRTAGMGREAPSEPGIKRQIFTTRPDRSPFPATYGSASLFRGLRRLPHRPPPLWSGSTRTQPILGRRTRLSRKRHSRPIKLNASAWSERRLNFGKPLRPVIFLLGLTGGQVWQPRVRICPQIEECHAELAVWEERGQVPARAPPGDVVEAQCQPDIIGIERRVRLSGRPGTRLVDQLTLQLLNGESNAADPVAEDRVARRCHA
jgi:hypothetical protein